MDKETYCFVYFTSMQHPDLITFYSYKVGFIALSTERKNEKNAWLNIFVTSLAWAITISRCVLEKKMSVITCWNCLPSFYVFNQVGSQTVADFAHLFQNVCGFFSSFAVLWVKFPLQNLRHYFWYNDMDTVLVSTRSDYPISDQNSLKLHWGV